jgi:mRNA interferase HigB
MRIIAKSTLRAFYEQPNNADSKSALEAWHYEVSKLRWSYPNDIKAQYRSASVVGRNKIVFNICGNKYRLIVSVNYDAGIVFVKFIGTHKAYDKVNIEEL